MSILTWIEDKKRLKLLNAPKNVSLSPDSSKGLWTRCDKCGVILYIKHLKENQRVCFGCSYHLQMMSQERIENLLDRVPQISYQSSSKKDSFARSLAPKKLYSPQNETHNARGRGERVTRSSSRENMVSTWRPLDETVSPCDPLKFHDQKNYTDRLKDAQERTGLQDAIQTGTGMIDGIPVALAVMDFSFMGGSMGSVVGEKITRLIEYATGEGLTLLIVSASGGARMQEGVFSLMQMAKISSALQIYQSCARLLYISILTSPTTGGVTASFAMLGDIIFAEPKALIAFAGRRVIEQTLAEDLPEDFQTSESMLHHGLIDLIVPRRFLRQAVSETIRLYKNAAFKKIGIIPFGVQNPITFLTEEKVRRQWKRLKKEKTKSLLSEHGSQTKKGITFARAKPCLPLLCSAKQSQSNCRAVPCPRGAKRDTQIREGKSQSRVQIEDLRGARKELTRNAFERITATREKDARKYGAYREILTSFEIVLDLFNSGKILKSSETDFKMENRPDLVIPKKNIETRSISVRKLSQLEKDSCFGSIGALAVLPCMPLLSHSLCFTSSTCNQSESIFTTVKGTGTARVNRVVSPFSRGAHVKGRVGVPIGQPRSKGNCFAFRTVPCPFLPCPFGARRGMARRGKEGQERDNKAKHVQSVVYPAMATRNHGKAERRSGKGKAKASGATFCISKSSACVRPCVPPFSARVVTTKLFFNLLRQDVYIHRILSSKNFYLRSVLRPDFEKVDRRKMELSTVARNGTGHTNLEIGFTDNGLQKNGSRLFFKTDSFVQMQRNLYKNRCPSLALLCRASAGQVSLPPREAAQNKAFENGAVWINESTSKIDQQKGCTKTLSFSKHVAFSLRKKRKKENLRLALFAQNKSRVAEKVQHHTPMFFNFKWKNVSGGLQNKIFLYKKFSSCKRLGAKLKQIEKNRVIDSNKADFCRVMPRSIPRKYGKRAFLREGFEGYRDEKNGNLVFRASKDLKSSKIGDFTTTEADTDFLNRAIELAATDSVEWRAFYIDQQLSENMDFLEDLSEKDYDFRGKNGNLLFYKSICRTQKALDQ